MMFLRPIDFYKLHEFLSSQTGYKYRPDLIAKLAAVKMEELATNLVKAERIENISKTTRN